MSTTILPPRYEASAAELTALPEIPVYEEVSGSLRPTWLPVDPATYTIAPHTHAPRRSRAGLVVGFAVAALAVWGVGFAAVVGGHAYFENRAKAAAAPSQPLVSEPSTRTNDIATVATQPTNAVTATTSASSVTLTVDVNDLPRARDAKPHGRKSHSRGS